MIRLVCLAAGLVALGGCGLIDSPISDIDLDLPEREVTIDTADWELTDEGHVPSVGCSDTPNVCTNRVEMWCGADEICAARCGGETCEVNVSVALYHTVDLTQENSDLERIPGVSLVSVTVDRVTFSVRENTLNREMPPLTVAVAPQGVMSIHDGEAEEVGTIPAIPAGTTVAEAELKLSANGQTVLAERMRDYKTPFNLLVGASIALRAGEEVPSGRLVAVVKVEAHASTGL